MKGKKYGVSYNCIVGRNDEVGGGGEGDTSIDFVSKDLAKLIAHVTKDGKGQGFKYTTLTDHEYVGQRVDVGGEVVAVIGEREKDGYFAVACVVFTSPKSPVEID